MTRQYQVPDGFINATATKQYSTPWGFLNETVVTTIITTVNKFFMLLGVGS